jgi:hypothetical protein
MRQYATLVRLFWRHLVRRKSLWVVIAIVGVVVLLNGIMQSQMKGMLESGVRYDIATRRAAAALDAYAEQIRGGAVMLVLVVAALIAPSSRKDGTTQFVLRPVREPPPPGRGPIRGAHLVRPPGYPRHPGRLLDRRLPPGHPAAGGGRICVDILLRPPARDRGHEPRPLPDAAALVVYAILLGVPYLLLPLLATFTNDWESTRVAPGLRLAAARTIENVGLLFPKVEALIAWPKLTWATTERPPFPSWPLEALHELAVVALWVVIGLWSYRRYDFGSRTPTK